MSIAPKKKNNKKKKSNKAKSNGEAAKDQDPEKDAGLENADGDGELEEEDAVVRVTPVQMPIGNET